MHVPTGLEARARKVGVRQVIHHQRSVLGDHIDAYMLDTQACGRLGGRHHFVQCPAL